MSSVRLGLNLTNRVPGVPTRSIKSKVVHVVAQAEAVIANPGHWLGVEPDKVPHCLPTARPAPVSLHTKRRAAGPPERLTTLTLTRLQFGLLVSAEFVIGVREAISTEIWEILLPLPTLPIPRQGTPFAAI